VDAASVVLAMRTAMYAWTARRQLDRRLLRLRAAVRRIHRRYKSLSPSRAAQRKPAPLAILHLLLHALPPRRSGLLHPVSQARRRPVGLCHQMLRSRPLASHLRYRRPLRPSQLKCAELRQHRRKLIKLLWLVARRLRMVLRAVYIGPPRPASTRTKRWRCTQLRTTLTPRRTVIPDRSCQNLTARIIWAYRNP